METISEQPVDDLISESKPDFCFVLSCHGRLIELLAHIDILSFCHIPHDVIVVYSGPYDIEPLIEPICCAIIHPRGHSLGAVLAFTKGLRIAREKGYRYMCFRNGDDWILNHFRVEFVLSKMRSGFKLAGYNWFGSGNYSEFALNDLYVDVDAVNGLDLDKWDRDFIRKIRGPCEGYIGSMLKSVIPDKHIFKLRDRERRGGIGMAFANSNNSRWFNLQWQLIGDHNLADRRKHWNQIKPLVPYADMLVAKSCFKCWLERCRVTI